VGRHAPSEVGVASEVLLRRKSSCCASIPARRSSSSEVDRALRWGFPPAFVEQLAQKGGLARATHPDHGVHLPGDVRESSIPPGEPARRHRRERGAELLGEDGMEAHARTRYHRCPSPKDRY
jgi:hypothetical protein